MIPLLMTGLRERRWAMFWWSAGLAFFNGLSILIYPTIRGQAAQLNQALAQMPAGAKSLLTDGNDFLSPVGYMSTKIFYLFLPLLFTILAINLGASLLASEERAGTIELLLARPLSRTRLLLGKALIALSVLLIVGGVTTATVVLFCHIISLGLPLGNIALAVGWSVVLGTLFGSIAFMMTAIGKAVRRSSVGLTAAIALGSYLVASLEAQVHWLETPAKLMPYHYYHPTDILNGIHHWTTLACYCIAILVLGLIAVVGFRRRDIAG